MTNKLELKSCHEVVYTVYVADVESIFYCKPDDPDILTVVMKDGKRLYCDEVCPVDSLQEEPKFKTGDRIKPIDKCLGSPRIIEEVCDGWYVTNQGTLDFEFEDNWELVREPSIPDIVDEHFMEMLDKEPVSKEIGDYDHKAVMESLHPELKKEPVSDIDFEQELYKAFGQVKNFYLGLQIAKRFYDMGKNHQGPVSEDLNEAAINYSKASTDGNVVDDWIVEDFKAGAEWSRNQAMAEIQTQSMALAHGCPKEEPVSEELDEYINELSKQFPEVSFAKLSRIAVRVSRWQQNQDVKNKLPKVIDRTELDEYAYQCAYDMSNDWAIDNPTWKNVKDACKLGAKWKEKEMQSTIELAEDHAMLAGMEKMKEQMMKEAVEATVMHYYSQSKKGFNGRVIFCSDSLDYLKTGDKVNIKVFKED